MLSFGEFNLMMESYRDAKTKWITQGSNPETINKAINTFKQMKKDNIPIDKDKADIGYWMKKTFDAFAEFVADINSRQVKKKEATSKASDVFRVFENDFALVVVPKTHEASQKYGANTQWCITGYSDYYWKEYINKDGFTPYYIIFKDKANIDTFDDKLDKVAVMVDCEGSISNIYNSNDDEISRDHFTQTVEEVDEDEDSDTYGDTYETEGDSMNIEDVFDLYLIPYEDFDSKVYEVYEGTGLELEQIDDFFPIDETVSGYAELMNYYEDENIPEDQRISNEELEEFIRHRYLLDCVGNGKREIDPDYINLLGDQVCRGIHYPEAEYIKRFVQNVNDYIDEIQEEEETTYELAA
jgi:hypothetical protein